MTDPSSSIDPIPPFLYPVLEPFSGDAPPMPESWSAVVLLHPFSPPQSNDPNPDNPFFQLCLANVSYVAGSSFSAQIAGIQGGTWWYVVDAGGTRVSVNGGEWTPVDVGWQLPDAGWFGSASPGCAGTSPLNWMPGPFVEWWKIPVAVPNSPNAATWMWFDAATRNPVRMMYGTGPQQSPAQGDPAQLPLFQMYSFTYFPEFVPGAGGVPAEWADPVIEGFQVGNPNGYQDFVWNGNFGMTAFMTPVNEAFNPLPTRVLYVWKPDEEYSVATDRAQDTLMLYTYNQPGPTISQEALLTGPPPAGMDPPVDSDTSFLITNNTDGTQSCAGPASQFDFPQEPPTWVSIPGVQGTIQATITNNPVLCPDATVTVFSVLFPPSPNNYPDSTYLWTWYSPISADGTESRPVTFMQSQSGVNLGTSLALADYFAYELLAQPIDPGNFTVPPSCAGQNPQPGTPALAAAAA